MRIVFCGVGALGSTAAVLCRNLEATLVFVDFDRVESKNLLAQAYVKQSIGKNKAEAFGVRLTQDNVETLCGGAGLLVDCFDNQASRLVLSTFARGANKPLVHAALAGDGTFGLVRWDARFAPDAEDAEGQATCEGGAHLPLIGLLAATLARAIQDFRADGACRDSMVSLAAVTPTL